LGGRRRHGLWGILYLSIMKSAVNTKQELIEIIHANEESISHFGVNRLGIFGSFVRDEANPESDVDFFIEFDPEKKTFKNFMGLSFLLEELTGRKVELVTPQSLSKYIGPYILKEVEYVPFAA
jgi:predicted nucleotidyltransferase